MTTNNVIQKSLSIVSWNLMHNSCRLKQKLKKLVQHFKFKISEFDFIKEMQHQKLKCQNEGFGCDPRRSVRGNLILCFSCDGKRQCVFWVLKLTFKMQFKQYNLLIQKFLLQNFSASWYVYDIAQSSKNTYADITKSAF